MQGDKNLEQEKLLTESSEHATGRDPFSIGADRATIKKLLKIDDAKLDSIIKEYQQRLGALGIILTGDQYLYLLGITARGLDEDVLTPLRNILYFIYHDQAQSQTAGFISFTLATSAVVTGAYLIAEYTRYDQRKLWQEFAAVELKATLMAQELTSEVQRLSPPSPLLGTEEPSKQQKNINDIQNQLNAIGERLFPDQYWVILVSINGKLTPILVRKNDLKKLDEEVKKEPEKPAADQTWLQRSWEIFTGFMDTLYSGLKMYGMWYWITWGIILLITGAALGPASPMLAIILAFSIPGAVTLPFLGFKFLDIFRKSPSGQKKLEDDSKAILQVYATEIMRDEMLQAIALDEEEKEPKNLSARAETAKDNLQNVLSLQPPFYSKLRRVTRLYERYYRLRGESAVLNANERALRAGFFAFLGNMVGMIIISWVTTDFASILFHLPFLAMSPANIPVIITVSLAAVLVGVFMGAKEYFKTKNDAQQKITEINKEKLDKQLDEFLALIKENALKQNIIEQSKQKFILLREQVRKKQSPGLFSEAAMLLRLQTRPESRTKELDHLIALCEIKFPEAENRTHSLWGLVEFESDSMSRGLEAHSGTMAAIKTVSKKFLNRALAFIDGLGTGSLISRFFLTGIAALLIPVLATPHGLAIVFGVAIALGIIIAAAKVYRYHMNKMQERDDRFVQELGTRIQQAKAESEVLDAQLIKVEHETQSLCANADYAEYFQPSSTTQTQQPARLSLLSKPGKSSNPKPAPEPSFPSTPALSLKESDTKSEE